MAEASDKRRAPVGAIIGLLFGGLWWLLAALAAPAPARLPAAVFGAAATLVLIVRAWRGATAGTNGGALFGRRAYLLAVAFELAAIVAANNVLPRAGLADYLIPVVGVIVGLHFIGLWIATHAMRFLAISAGMCALSALAMLAPADGAINLRVIAAGVGDALVLWIGASWR